MTTNALALAAVLVAPVTIWACAHVERDARPYQLKTGDSLRGVSSLSDLETAIADLVEANRDCRFPERLRVRLPTPQVSWHDIEGGSSRLCLGETLVASVRREDETLVSIELTKVPRPGRKPGATEDTYVTFARLREGRWTLSWPASLGPELHSEDRNK